MALGQHLPLAAEVALAGTSAYGRGPRRRRCHPRRAGGGRKAPPTCEANDVNPEAYLADVLLRVQTHPHARIGELLPHGWKRLRAADSS